MSITDGSAERRAPADDNKVEETRRAMAEYRALPLARKVVRRLTSNYPSYEDRQKLIEHDMTPFERIDQKVKYKTFPAGFLDDRPPFMDDKGSAYHEMLRESDQLYTSRYVSLRCNPIAREIVRVAEDSRTGNERIDDPWYAGLYRQVMPRQSLFSRQQQVNIGIFLTDQAGVQFEAVEFDEALVDSLLPEAREELVEFVANMPVPPSRSPHIPARTTFL